jgi:transposase-like protein
MEIEAPIKITSLTKELKAQITELYESGREYSEISTIVGIDLETLKTLYIQERHDRLIKSAEHFSEDLLKINKTDKSVNTKLLSVKQKEAEFVRSTLGKDLGYAKREELTGRNGGAIEIASIVFHPPKSAPIEIKNEA